MCLCSFSGEIVAHKTTIQPTTAMTVVFMEVYISIGGRTSVKQCFLREGGGGGGGIEHLEAVYAWAHTLLAYTTILCRMKKGVLHSLPPFGGNTGK